MILNTGRTLCRDCGSERLENDYAYKPGDTEKWVYWICYDCGLWDRDPLIEKLAVPDPRIEVMERSYHD